jgi:hypothetical protein
VLCDRLSAHVQVIAQLSQGLPAVRVQQIEQFPAAGIGQRLEYSVSVVHASISGRVQYMQVNTCMSRGWCHMDTAVTNGHDSNGRNRPPSRDEQPMLVLTKGLHVRTSKAH